MINNREFDDEGNITLFGLVNKKPSILNTFNYRNIDIPIVDSSLDPQFKGIINDDGQFYLVKENGILKPISDEEFIAYKDYVKPCETLYYGNEDEIYKERLINNKIYENSFEKVPEDFGKIICNGKPLKNPRVGTKQELIDKVINNVLEYYSGNFGFNKEDLITEKQKEYFTKMFELMPIDAIAHSQNVSMYTGYLYNENLKDNGKKMTLEQAQEAIFHSLGHDKGKALVNPNILYCEEQFKNKAEGVKIFLSLHETMEPLVVKYLEKEMGMSVSEIFPNIPKERLHMCVLHGASKKQYDTNLISDSLFENGKNKEFLPVVGEFTGALMAADLMDAFTFPRNYHLIRYTDYNFDKKIENKIPEIADEKIWIYDKYQKRAKETMQSALPYVTMLLEENAICIAFKGQAKASRERFNNYVPTLTEEASFYGIKVITDDNNDKCSIPLWRKLEKIKKYEVLEIFEGIDGALSASNKDSSKHIFKGDNHLSDKNKNILK